ncbi:sorting nexin-29-like [Saccostrea echinata]|uniref:sorting nexin-29-like n=1 Tax=Saccostrea echinata TaxID=191078 RepID=UPI002A80BAE3|nr:sorting nexin-29-like [Saccostrea echinata]
MNGDDGHSAEKQSILTRLLDAVKQCQVRFGGRTELAADADSRVSCLCAAWEVALQHGMKQNKALTALKQVTNLTRLNKVTDIITDITSKETEPVFWQYVKESLTKHEQDRFYSLKNISTDTGRGRAWLRSTLNEHSLERNMHMILESEELLRQYYESWAFMRDQERSSMMPMMAAGLGSILFAINIDNPDLNAVKRVASSNINIPVTSKPVLDKIANEPRPVIAGEEGSAPPQGKHTEVRKKEKKKRKKNAHIVSFDEDDSGTFSADPDQSEHSSKYTIGSSDLTPRSLEGETIDESSELDSQIPSLSIHDNSSSDLRTHLSVEMSYQREASINSETSYDRPPSVQSLSSADFEISDSIQGLVPLSKEGQPITSRDVRGVPRISDSLSTSVDSTGSLPKFSGYDIESAALALDMAQKGTNSSFSRTAGDGVNVEEVIQRETMSTEELKKAVVAMMVRKDEVEEQNKSIQAMLQQEMETSSMLRAEIEEMKQMAAVKQEKEQAKYQTLQKENELLKHQLRRYVNAVQMLRAEGSQVDDSLGIHLEEPQPSIPPAKSTVDYSHEASEYEKKLIQVAEMHGELMEFNEMLHRQLNAKEGFIRRLQGELVDLRGPLPQDLLSAGEETNADLDQQASVRIRSLVNIWIPAAFLQGAASDAHHVYQIYVRIKDEEWNVYKRFSQFHQFHNQIKKIYPKTGKFEFPPKKTIGKKDAKVVENRRKVFQTYLRLVINLVFDNDKTKATSVNKEVFIQKLPFFSDRAAEKNDGKKVKKNSSSSSLSTSPGNQSSFPQPQYEGL